MTTTELIVKSIRLLNERVDQQSKNIDNLVRIVELLTDITELRGQSKKVSELTEADVKPASSPASQLASSPASDTRGLGIPAL